MNNLISWSVLFIMVPTMSQQIQSEWSCIGTYQCQNDSIICTQNEDCNVVCNGDRSCENVIFSCPINKQCNITCIGDAACWGALINATLSSIVYIKGCTAGDPTNNDLFTCENIDLYCPPNINGIKKCIVQGNDYGLSNCLTGHQMCTGSDPVGLGGLHFFAINGWKDMQFIYTGNQYTSVDNQGGPGTMHCKTDYKANCLIAANWICDEGGSTVCNDPYPSTSAPTTRTPTTSIPTTNMPSTNNPTTTIPTTSIPSTSNPTTLIPTTNMPTNMPTNMASTNAPTTNSPTTIPTYFPSMNPTTNVPSTNIPSTYIPTSDQLSIWVPSFSPLVVVKNTGIDNKLSTFNEEVEDKHGNSYFWTAIYIVMFVICCCICIFCIMVMYRIKKSKSIIKENTEQMELTHTAQYNFMQKNIKIEKRLSLENIVDSTSNTLGGDTNGYVKDDEFIVNGNDENNDIITDGGDMQQSKQTEGYDNHNIAEDEFIVESEEVDRNKTPMGNVHEDEFIITEYTSGGNEMNESNNIQNQQFVSTDDIQEDEIITDEGNTVQK
eukprot:478223_1